MLSMPHALQRLVELSSAPSISDEVFESYRQERHQLFKSGELRQWAMAGNVVAQYHLAVHLFENRFQARQSKSLLTDRHLKESVYWYKKAVEQGHAQAMVNLAFNYLSGIGVKKDEKKFEELSLEAVKHDAILAINNLGPYYYQQRRFGEAVPLLARAAENGFPEKYILLGSCYRDGMGVQQDFVKAAELYVKGGAYGDDSEGYNAIAKIELLDLWARVEEKNLVREIKNGVYEFVRPLVAKSADVIYPKQFAKPPVTVQ